MGNDRNTSNNIADACPRNGIRGKAVKAITLDSLLAGGARLQAKGLDGFRFCDSPDCEIVYYHPESGQMFAREDLGVRVGQKEAGPSRQVCYCFGYTAADIDAEVAATGASRIPDDITEKCRQGLDRCEETNPQGRCCLGNVRKAYKEALARYAASELTIPESM